MIRINFTLALKILNIKEMPGESSVKVVVNIITRDSKLFVEAAKKVVLCFIVIFVKYVLHFSILILSAEFLAEKLLFTL